MCVQSLYWLHSLHLLYVCTIVTFVTFVICVYNRYIGYIRYICYIGYIRYMCVQVSVVWSHPQKSVDYNFTPKLCHFMLPCIFRHQRVLS
jgi:hypothetical protein